MTKAGTLALVGLGAALLALFAGSSKAAELPPAPPPEPPEPEPVPPPARPPYIAAPSTPATPSTTSPGAGPVRPSELERLQAGYRILRKSELTPELVRTAEAMLKLGDAPGKMYPFDYQGRHYAGVVTRDKRTGKRGVVLLERPV